MHWIPAPRPSVNMDAESVTRKARHLVIGSRAWPWDPLGFAHVATEPSAPHAHRNVVPTKLWPHTLTPASCDLHLSTASALVGIKGSSPSFLPASRPRWNPASLLLRTFRWLLITLTIRWQGRFYCIFSLSSSLLIIVLQADWLSFAPQICQACPYLRAFAHPTPA